MPAGQGTWRGKSAKVKAADNRNNMRNNMLKKAGIAFDSGDAFAVQTSKSGLKDGITSADYQYRKNTREAAATHERAHLTPYKAYTRERGRSTK